MNECKGYQEDKKKKQPTIRSILTVTDLPVTEHVNARTSILENLYTKVELKQINHNLYSYRK